jgi:hypothetical protein
MEAIGFIGKGNVMTKLTTLEKVQSIATLDNAFQWRKEDEKAMFCADLLAQVDLGFNEARLEVLEALLEQALETYDRMMGYL